VGYCESTSEEKVQESKKHLVSFLVGVAENVAANVAVVAIPIIVGILFTFYSNNPQTALLWVAIGLVVLNSLGTLAVLRQQRISSKWRSKGILLQDDENQVPYLVDVHGKARQVPDVETLSYLQWALGTLNEMPAIPTKEIVKLRGESLPSIKKWKRPLTPEEQEARDLQVEVSRILSLETVFEESATLQRIRVTIINRGEELVHVQKARFQHHGLPETALSPSYAKEDMLTIIPFDQTAASLSQGTNLTMELQLRQTWKRRDIENMKGRLGFLLLDVVYKGKLVESIPFQL